MSDDATTKIASPLTDTSIISAINMTQHDLLREDLAVVAGIFGTAFFTMLSIRKSNQLINQPTSHGHAPLMLSFLAVELVVHMHLEMFYRKFMKAVEDMSLDNSTKTQAIALLEQMKYQLWLSRARIAVLTVAIIGAVFFENLFKKAAPILFIVHTAIAMLGDLMLRLKKWWQSEERSLQTLPKYFDRKFALNMLVGSAVITFVSVAFLAGGPITVGAAAAVLLLAALAVTIHSLIKKYKEYKSIISDNNSENNKPTATVPSS